MFKGEHGFEEQALNTEKLFFAFRFCLGAYIWWCSRATPSLVSAQEWNPGLPLGGACTQSLGFLSWPRFIHLADIITFWEQDFEDESSKYGDTIPQVAQNLGGDRTYI